MKWLKLERRVSHAKDTAGILLIVLFKKRRLSFFFTFFVLPVHQRKTSKLFSRSNLENTTCVSWSFELLSEKNKLNYIYDVFET